MLAYASGRQQVARRGSSPPAMLLVVAAHIAAVALVMSARMVTQPPVADGPTDVTFVPIKEPPPPPPAPPAPQRPAPQSTLDNPAPIVPQLPPVADPVDTRPFPPVGPVAGNDIRLPEPFRPLPPIAQPVRTGPRLATPEGALKPPYPRSKLDSQEEAALKLRLSIDENGRVTSVEAVGPVDRAFFEAARKHLTARWRYKPATVDGNPIASSTVITLRFQLEG